MLLNKTDIEKRMRAVRGDAAVSERLLEEVRSILASDTRERERIEANISGGRDTPINHFDFDLLETDRIYHLG